MKWKGNGAKKRLCGRSRKGKVLGAKKRREMFMRDIQEREELVSCAMGILMTFSLMKTKYTLQLSLRMVISTREKSDTLKPLEGLIKEKVVDAPDIEVAIIDGAVATHIVKPTKEDYYPTASLHDSAPNTPLHDSGPTTPLNDSAPTTPLNDSAPNTPLHDSAPNTPLHDSAPNTPLYDSAPNTPLHYSRPTAPQHDSVPTTPQHDSAEPLHDSAPNAPQHDSVPTALLHDYASTTLLNDSTPKATLNNSAPTKEFTNTNIWNSTPEQLFSNSGQLSIEHFEEIA
ncbi:unnamed protein product [Owenia fusiformis]|uniref:Uncharacterized protein n=1 Tax=Owenia fusiformis TaxID=6347 RepID=A0A8J1UQ62_OWEFU|nr:unnamed protein product [Owenia fusiformis]